MTPKAIIKEEKKEKVNKLAENLKSAKSFVLVDYSGIDVKAQQTLKNKLKEVKADMLVAKNSLIKLAGKKAQIADEILKDEILSGQSALVLAREDAVSPIQILGKFISENEIPDVKAGVVEGIFQDKEAILKISKLPTKEVLLSQVVGCIGQPMNGLVMALQSNMLKLSYILLNFQ
jgi:large subunit ribosomal protein L10